MEYAVLTKEEIERARRGETCLCGQAVVGQCAACGKHACADEYVARAALCIDCYADATDPLY